jgi:hypothetical protein
MCRTCGGNGASSSGYIAFAREMAKQLPPGLLNLKGAQQRLSVPSGQQGLETFIAYKFDQAAQAAKEKITAAIKRRRNALSGNNPIGRLPEEDSARPTYGSMTVGQNQVSLKRAAKYAVSAAVSTRDVNSILNALVQISKGIDPL